jgi:hypothetical protein
MHSAPRQLLLDHDLNQPAIQLIPRAAAPHAIEDGTGAPADLRAAAVFGFPAGNDDSRHLPGRGEKPVNRDGRPSRPLPKEPSLLRLFYDRLRHRAELFPILASLDANVDNFPSAHGGDCLRGATTASHMPDADLVRAALQLLPVQEADRVEGLEPAPANLHSHRKLKTRDWVLGPRRFSHGGAIITCFLSTKVGRHARDRHVAAQQPCLPGRKSLPWGLQSLIIYGPRRIPTPMDRPTEDE